MTIDNLEHFLAAARYKKFSKAAEELHLSHSSLSRSVAAIEEELGLELFERSKNGLALTDAGRYLLREGEVVLKSFSALLSGCRSFYRETTGRLVIRGNLFPGGFLTECYRQFTAQYPGVELDIDLGSYSMFHDLNELKHGGVDVALMLQMFLIDDIGEFQFLKVQSEMIGVMVGPTHPLAARESLRMADLQGQSYIAAKKMDSLYVVRMVNEQLRGAGLEQLHLGDYAGYANSEGDQFLRVRLGEGIVFVPAGAGIAPPWGCTIKRLEDVTLSLDLYMVWARNNANPALSLFVNQAKEYLAQLDGAAWDPGGMGASRG